MTHMSICVVFVANKLYMGKFIESYEALRIQGRYFGDVVLIVGDDQDHKNLRKNPRLKRVHIIKPPNIHFPTKIAEKMKKVKGNDRRAITKRFQWHKLYVFHPFFKKWRYVLYMDSGTHIWSNIAPLLHKARPGRILAHSDAYPEYIRTLRSQFDDSADDFAILEKKYNLDCDYFQTGLMLFDTTIITRNTFSFLYNLACVFPFCRTNEQGIVALYFTSIVRKWSPLSVIKDTVFYDFKRRFKDKRYVITKH